MEGLFIDRARVYACLIDRRISNELSVERKLFQEILNVEEIDRSSHLSRQDTFHVRLVSS